MAKKLCIVWLLITMVSFSSFSIYASAKTSAQVTEEKGSHTAAAPTKIVAAMAVQKTAVDKANEDKEAKEKEEEERKNEEIYQEGLAAYIRQVNPSVTDTDAADMAGYFVAYAEEYGLDEKVVMAVAQNESTYYCEAVSCEDFKGLMQTGDGLARNAGYEPEDLFEPEVSIEVGSQYLADKLTEFDDLELALTAYNQGSGAVRSGNYTTGYAELAMARAEDVETFLKENGYTAAED